MKSLMRSEWERLWKRKTTWLLFFSIPVVQFAAARYLLSQNEQLSPDVAHYTVAWNFPTMALAEMLFTAFQGAILMIITFLVTQEYQDRTIRMVMIRSYSNLEIIVAKYVVAYASTALFFLTYFIVSYGIGAIFFTFPKELPLFYHQGMATPFEGFIYNLSFYGVALFTSLAIVSVMFFLACLSRTTTTAMGAGMGFLLVSFMYPQVLAYVQPLIGKELFMKLFFTSIPMIQWEGITYMLAEKPFMVTYNVGIICSYIVVFTSLTILFMKKNDFFN